VDVCLAIRRVILYLVITFLMTLHSRTTFLLFIATVTLLTALPTEYHPRFRSNRKYVEQKPLQDSVYMDRRPDEKFDPFDLTLPFSTIVVRRSKRRINYIDNKSNNPHLPQPLCLANLHPIHKCFPLPRLFTDRKITGKNYRYKAVRHRPNFFLI
jgi:hypothetical protein